MDVTKEYSISLLHGMEKLLQEECLCDVVFEVEDKQFPCHRTILSAVSDYFKTMFTTQLRNQNEKVIKLDFLDASKFRLLLDFLYSGKNILSEENAHAMLEIAHYTRIEVLQEACIKFLIERLTMDNCIEVWHLGQKLCLQNLIDETVSYVTKNLDQMILNKSLLEATADDIEVTLASPESSLPSEDRITEFLLRWLTQNLEQSTKETKARIYNLFRLPLCSGEYLVSLKQKYKTIFSDREFSALFEHAIEYHLQPARASDLLSTETEQRPASEFENVLMVFATGCGVFGFSFRKEVWYRLQNLPYKKETYFAVCLYNPSIVYLSGGTQTPSMMLRYGGEVGTWSNITMPFLIYRHSMVAINKYIYVLGGRSRDDKLMNENKGYKKKTDAVRRYDPVQDTWCVVGRLPYAMSDASSVVVKSKIYLIGGEYPNESNKFVENKSVVIFDVLTDSCTEIKLDRYNFSDSKLFTFACRSNILIKDCEGNGGTLDTDSQTFETVPMLEKENIEKINFLHLYQNQWIVFGETEDEDIEDYDVVVFEAKPHRSDILDCGKATKLTAPPFKRNNKITRCITVLIRRTHLRNESNLVNRRHLSSSDDELN